MRCFQKSTTLIATFASGAMFAASFTNAQTAVTAPLAPAQSKPIVAPQVERPLRLAIIGASASAGFGCFAVETREDGKYGAAVDLQRCVKLACTERACVVTDLASSLFFSAPVKRGEGQMTRALKSNPDGIIAIDYLFWYVYGFDGPTGDFLKDEEERAAKLELGLAQLALCPCPVVVGDLPDMSASVGKMLSSSQMPQLATIVKLNTRLKEWAASHPHVCIFPLAALSEKLRVESVIEINGVEWKATADEPLVQDDLLHPTARGLAGMAAVALKAIDPLLAEEFRAKCPADPAAIFQHIQKSLPKLPESRQQAKVPLSTP